MPQAAAYLHWADWLRAAAIKAGKRPLFINLDETSISRSWPQSRGNVLKKQMWISKHRPPTVKASKAEYRGTITGVLMITHDEVIQRVLPQVYIGNTRAFPKKAHWRNLWQDIQVSFTFGARSRPGTRPR